MPNTFSVLAPTGERLYAVHMEAQFVSNQADLNTGAVSLGASWEINKATRLTGLVGQSRFKERVFNNSYNLVYAYAGLSFSW